MGCGAQFQRLGQKLVEGRYPLHIHMAGDAPDLVVKNNLLAWNQQRGLVLHGVNQMLAESNVIYRSNGHLVMLEDAIEMNNRGARFVFNNSRLLDCGNALVSGLVSDKIRVY